MGYLTIPVRADVNEYEMTVELEAVNYVLGFCYNERLDRWVMRVANTAGEDIVAGIVLLTDCDLTSRFRANADMPPGTFWVIDESGEAANPTLDTLGSSCVLVYRESTTTDE